MKRKTASSEKAAAGAKRIFIVGCVLVVLLLGCATVAASGSTAEGEPRYPFVPVTVAVPWHAMADWRYRELVSMDPYALAKYNPTVRPVYMGVITLDVPERLEEKGFIGEKWEYSVSSGAKISYDIFTKTCRRYDINVFWLRNTFFVASVSYKIDGKTEKYRFILDGETTPDLPWVSWNEFLDHEAEATKAWAELHRRLPPDYRDTLREDMEDAFCLHEFLPAHREEILDLFEAFHNPSGRAPDEAVQKRMFFMQDKGPQFQGLIWKVAVSPNFISCYTDGVAYALLSPDMASRDLFQYR